jgi:aminopeptidase N
MPPAAQPDAQPDAMSASAAPAVIRREDYSPPAWRVPDVALRFELAPERTLVHATLSVERAADGPLVLDCETLELLAVAVDGAAVPARIADGKLALDIAGDRATVTTTVAISPAANTKLMGLYASGGILCTQCEAEGFRRITPFPDRPDVLSRYRVRLEADKAAFPVLLSNGNPGAAGDLGGGRHFAEWDDPFPKPCYLFAVVAGDLAPFRDSFTTTSGRRVDLAIWVREPDLPRCAHAMAALKSSMRWDEEQYGREYDLDVFNIVAVADFNFGAMENKGLNIFNSKYILADAETATDADFDAVAAVVAHEYFHNWTGNRVTCRDWFQLSLKEGLTVYRDQEFSADTGSRAVKRIEDVRVLRAAQFPEDAGPLAHPVRPDSYIEISNFYTATVYNKGAEVIRMMAALIGPEAYRRGCDLYFERHDGQAVTVEDWVRAHEAASGRDLAQFRRWYANAGTPKVTLAVAHAGDTATLTLTQSVPDTPGQTAKPPMHMPIRLKLFDADSGAALGDERLVELTEATTVLRIDGVARPPLVSINRGFTAPVVVEGAETRAALARLAACDDDPFARFEAMQRLGLDVLTAAAGGADPADPALVEAVGATLASGLDPAFIAEAVLLPTESFVGDRMALVDPAAIHRGREGARRALLDAHRDAWWRVYRSNSDNRYEATGPAKARRRLKNVALAYLCADDGADAIAAAAAQFDAADNMTDRIAALGVLVNSARPAREAALAAFHRKFAGDALVIDKWFTAQALSTRADALQQALALRDHPDFTRNNPNRLRALVGAFGVNQARLHDPAGAGYRFIADEVLAVDAINPQSAARIVQPLTRWRRFAAPQAGLMKAELERLAAHPGLSRDVFEVVSKGLA